MNARQVHRLHNQQITRQHAVHNGEPWSRHDFQYMERNLHKTDFILGMELGRTEEAIAHQRYMIGLKKRQPDAEKLPPTQFQYHCDELITDTTFHHAGASLTVWFPASTPDRVLQDAFIAQGYTTEIFTQWLQERTHV